MRVGRLRSKNSRSRAADPDIIICVLYHCKHRGDYIMILFAWRPRQKRLAGPAHGGS